MKTFLITAMVSLISYSAAAQAKFEKGYFITSTNEKTECFIKSRSWQKTPKVVYYKLTDTSSQQSITPPDVREFAIDGGLRFISEDVMIDVSSDDVQQMSDDPNPVWSNQRLFLKVLVEGKASLYLYQTASMTRFFYKTADKPVQQLIWKRFKSFETSQYVEKTNVGFRQQLLNDVSLNPQDINKVEQLAYEKDALLKYFIEYNIQSGTTYTKYSRRHEKGEFHLRVTPGLNFSSIKIDNTYLDGLQTFNLGGKFGFRIGIEPELIFPYTNKMLALVLEPTFQYYKSSATSLGQTIDVQMYTIEFPIGLRFYLFPSKKVKIFLDAFFIPAPTIHPNSTVNYENSEKIKFSMGNSFAAGVGMNWKRLSAEIRGYSNRRFFSGSSNMKGYYYRLSLIFGFRIF